MDSLLSIEDTSNGRAMSFKWKCNRVFFDIYRIVILTNQAPTVQQKNRPGKEDEIIKETLSPERWLILQIVGGLHAKLKERSWEEFKKDGNNNEHTTSATTKRKDSYYGMNVPTSRNTNNNQFNIQLKLILKIHFMG